MEWISYFVISFVELIAWIIAVSIDPMFYVIWAYVSLWGSIILYGVPVVLIIVHSTVSNTANLVNWTTDGALPHLIVDIFLWIMIALFHYFFYP